jgi:hypothetical protein
VNLSNLLATLSSLFSSSSNAATTTRIPEWQGWAVLGTLLFAFGALVWWLYFSRLGDPTAPPGRSRLSPQAQRVLAGLILLSGVSFTTGARWDELWHRMYGGFADDFLWPPHLMIYGSLGLNSAFAGLGLTLAARGSGGIRDRFRANPLVGLLGLLAAYQLASIPSDLLWHKIIGPDISAWSLPHFLLMITASAVLLIGVALILSNGSPRPWRIGGRPGWSDAATLVLIVTSTLALLQFGVTEWEWSGSFDLILGRPVWVYPLVVVAVGAIEAHLILFSLRRVGAATVAAIAAVALQAAFIAFARSALPPGPTLASHLLLVLPALVLDSWYAIKLSRATATSPLVAGALIYGVVASLEICLLVRLLVPYPLFSPSDIAIDLVGGMIVAVALAFLARATAAWLMTPRAAVATLADTGHQPALSPRERARVREFSGTG